MYRQKVASAIAELREAAAQAAWTQWAAIFSFPASKRRAHAIVDPEALLLGSLALSEHEPRLRGVVQLWARHESRLLSVQRMKNLVPLFRSAVRERLAEFARLAVTEGGDQRWRSVASRSSGAKPIRQRDRPERPAGMAFLGGDVWLCGRADGMVAEASCGVRLGARIGSTGHRV